MYYGTWNKNNCLKIYTECDHEIPFVQVTYFSEIDLVRTISGESEGWQGLDLSQNRKFSFTFFKILNLNGKIALYP